MPKLMTPSPTRADNTVARMHPTRIDLPEEHRIKLVKLLNERLADSIDLAGQCKQAHWNVKGPNFIALHELFDQVHGRVAGHTDEIAERITALGGTALGTVPVVARSSTLRPYPTDIFDGAAHIAALAERLAAFGKNARQAIDEAADLGDQDTADLFTGISRAIDKDLWFVEAHAQTER